MPEEILETPVEGWTNDVEEVLPEVEITIFTTPDCVKCRSVKDYLFNRHVSFTEKNAENYPQDIEESGFQSVPVMRIIKWKEKLWFWDIEEFIHWIEDNGLGFQE
jgi:glutaredoxin